jgi:hypothetical protein
VRYTSLGQESAEKSLSVVLKLVMEDVIIEEDEEEGDDEESDEEGEEHDEEEKYEEEGDYEEHDEKETTRNMMRWIWTECDVKAPWLYHY